MTQYKLCTCNKNVQSKPSNSCKDQEKEKTYKSKKSITDKIPSQKSSKKEINLCACGSDVKSVCRCKASKANPSCEEKNPTPNPRPNSKLNINFNLPRASSTPLPLKGNALYDQFLSIILS